MKKIYLIITLLASLFLTSCENTNNNTAKNSRTEINEQENNTNPIEEQNTERISYKDYIEKYGESLFPTAEEQNNNSSEEDTDISEEENIEEVIPYNQLETFSTPLLSSSKERTHNIKIVCERLNNFILNPNEVFSYNDVCRPIWTK